MLCGLQIAAAAAPDLPRRAHAQGLLVTPYTFRNDDPWNETEQASCRLPGVWLPWLAWHL